MHPHSVDSLSGLSVDSSRFRQRAPRVQLSDDPDTATAQTVAEMCRQIHQAAKDPLVIQVARRAVQMFKGGPGWALQYSPDETRRAAESCWWWCKHYLRFKHHGSMFEAWSSELGDPRTKLQLLIAPDALVRMERMEGDCAIYTMMLCAMLEALGLQWQIVTAAVDRNQPQIFSHVWARVVLPGGVESLDASHGKYPGWQVPAYDLHRVWVFDANGQRVSEQGPGFSGLHDYRRSRGMGEITYDPVTGDAYDWGNSNPYLQPGGTETDLGSGYFGTTPQSGAITVPAQNSAQWGAFANSLKGVLTLAQMYALKPGMQVLPNGTVQQQNPGYAIGTPTVAANLGISSSTLMIGGLIVAGVFLMSMMKGGR